MTRIQFGRFISHPHTRAAMALKVLITVTFLAGHFFGPTAAQMAGTIGNFLWLWTKLD